jgi:tetratricopeptide (TPR) repeat protein
LQAIGLVRVGEVADALHLAARAIETMQQVPDPVRRAALGTRTWNNVSVVYEALGDIDKAVEAITAALGFAEQSGDPVMLAISTCNHWLYQLARLRGLGVRAGDPERTAVQRGLRQHFEACELAGHDTLVAGMAEALAEALMDEDRDDEARATVRQGVGAAARAGLGPEQARLELRMAELERRAGAVRRASAHMASALELALQADDKELLARCHLENSYLQEAQSRWRAALDSSRRHAEVLQTLLQARAARGAVEQAALLETERRRWCPR